MELGALIADRFRLAARVGLGGSTVVFRAHDEQTGAVVAVRWFREAGAGEGALRSTIEHPALPRCLAHGEGFLVTEWVNGETLEQRLRERGLTVRETCAVGRELAGALAALHQRSIVHGRLRPANVVFADHGVKLIDAGAAGETDPRSDVFALGLVLYECLAGHHPFPAERRGDAPSLAPLCPEAPTALVALVARMLAIEPAERPAGGGAIVAELASLSELDDEVRRRSTGAQAAAAAQAQAGAREETVSDDDAAGDEGGPPAGTFQTHPRLYHASFEVGRGGMGRILAAQDTRLDRVVAIKQLLPGRSAARFARESILTARLDHPSIVPVYDAGTSESGLPFYTMKLVSGRSLSAAIASAPSLPQRLALLPHALAVAEAIAYAHSKGIIHRDIKPSNVIVGEFGETLVVDWGAAKDVRRHDEAEPDAVAPSPSRSDDETALGEVVGTPAYMAPEQADGQPADERSDVYSLGALLYKLLAGEAPQASRTVTTGGARARPGEPATPSGRLGELRLRVPADLLAIVDKAMASAPSARYASARELADDLRRFMTGKLVGARRYGAWDLLRHSVRRHRGVVLSSAIALALLLVGAIYSVQRIVRASAANERLLRDASFEQGRMHMLDGDTHGALAPLATAYRAGSTGAAIRLLLEEAARPTRARLFTLAGHGAKVFTVGYSPDGRWLVTGGADGTARVWDGATGLPRLTLPNGDEVVAAAFSPDSRLLATGGRNGRVRIWDVLAAREVAELRLDAAASNLAFGPDSSILLTVSSHGVLSRWEIPGGTLAAERALDLHDPTVTFVTGHECMLAWSPTRLVVHDRTTLARRASFDSETWIFAAAETRDCDLVVMGDAGGQITLLRGGAVTASWKAHEGAVFATAVSPDATLIASGGTDGKVRLWSSAGEPIASLTAHHARVSRMTFTPDGDRLITAAGDGSVRLWTTTGMTLGEMSGHDDLVTAMDIRPDGGRLATASWDGTAIVWDLARAAGLSAVVSDRARSPALIAFDPTGRRLAIARADGSLAVAEGATWAVSCSADGAPAITRLAWSGAQMAAVRDGAAAVELWDPERCVRTATLEHPASIASIAGDADGRLVTAAGNVVRVWNHGRLEATMGGYPGTIPDRPRVGLSAPSVGLHGDEVHAITEDPPAVVVDVIGDPTRRRVLRDGSSAYNDVWFDPPGGTIYGAAAQSRACIWDARGGALLGRLEATGPLAGLRLSPDGTRLVGMGGYAPVVWDRKSGARVGTLERHSDLVVAGDFIDDQLFVTLAFDKVVDVWDLVTGRPLLTFRDVEALAVSPDRRAVALSGAAGVFVWSPRLAVPEAP